MLKKKQVISSKVLLGEPLDGSGRACIHLFVQDEKGLFIEPHALHPVFRDGVQARQEVTVGPARGYLACNPTRNPASVVHNNIIEVTHRTDDPRAVTCPKCKVSTGYLEMVRKMEAIINSSGNTQSTSR